MDGLLAALEASDPATWLSTARWGYAAVSALHVLGIALLVGAILPLDLRRLGAVRSVPEAALARVLVPTAATGLALATGSGALLFLPRASEYAALDVFAVKLALVGAGAVLALGVHAAEVRGPWPARRRAAVAALSAVIWLAALALGRLVAFV